MNQRNAGIGIFTGTLVLIGALVWISRPSGNAGRAVGVSPEPSAPPLLPAPPVAGENSGAAAPHRPEAAPIPAAGITSNGAAPKPAPAKAPPPLAFPAERAAAREVVEHVQFTIRDFRLALGENPVGDNAEITRALLGENRKQVRFAIPEGSTVNWAGQLCDPWGTPYFFHALARDHMEVRSAGPDLKMWTADDLQQ